MCANCETVYTNRGTKCVPTVELQCVPTGEWCIPTGVLSANQLWNFNVYKQRNGVYQQGYYVCTICGTSMCANRGIVLTKGGTYARNHCGTSITANGELAFNNRGSCVKINKIYEKDFN
ncbi:hypothetical protein DPMN_091630 [Dreissena polymorpha]|uniref:Uncharacterized protein n=1 Tax=Dreissena polymorpha TaxID=45954 RepID=A0A9D4L0V7_DREPO|nr:hypothetical protein DPMN_091630 [Dreissena polymorpha]